MYKRLLLFCILLFLSACDRLPVGRASARTPLSDKEFVEVYAKLTRATSPEAKAAILEQHGTSEKELAEFVRVRLRDLPRLSGVFDSVVARLGSDGAPVDVPRLPVR